MPAIRHVAIRHFRGFEEFATPLPRHVVVVGEPGAGRSDLVEAIVRVLDPDYWRAHRADELDFHELDSSRAAQVELTIGALTQAGLDALTPHLELWASRSGPA
jgi:putative ATP-dependent endonuclease of OLD family